MTAGDGGYRVLTTQYTATCARIRTTRVETAVATISVAFICLLCIFWDV